MQRGSCGGGSEPGRLAVFAYEGFKEGREVGGSVEAAALEGSETVADLLFFTGRDALERAAALKANLEPVKLAGLEHIINAAVGFVGLGDVNLSGTNMVEIIAGPPIHFAADDETDLVAVGVLVGLEFEVACGLADVMAEVSKLGEQELRGLIDLAVVLGHV